MYRRIGNTELNVFAIGLGAMPLSITGRPNRERALEVIDAALDAGVNFIDTANCYCLDHTDIGHNERLISDCLRHRKAVDIIVATKGGLTRPDGRWERDGRPASLRAACDQSLRDLDVETIPLYQFHAPDPAVTFVDSIGELARLQDAGKISHLGLSNVDVSHLEMAREIIPVVSVQNRCNVLCKDDLKNGVVDYCRQHGITYLPYSPVGGGNGHNKLPGEATLKEIADRHGISVYCVALSWLLHKGEHILPIPGASQPNSILDSVKAVGTQLTDTEIAQIDRIPD